MTNDALDKKLNEVFTGKVARKDLLLQVKKGTKRPLRSFWSSCWRGIAQVMTLVRFSKGWLPFSKLFRRTTFARTRVTKRR